MVLRIRAGFVSVGLVAALGVVAVVQAQEEVPLGTPDSATAAAIADWRAASLALVSPSLQGTVAAMYAGEPVDASLANAASIAKMQAEQQAWLALDKSTAKMIKAYFAQSDFDTSNRAADSSPSDQ